MAPYQPQKAMTGPPQKAMAPSEAGLPRDQQASAAPATPPPRALTRPTPRRQRPSAREVLDSGAVQTLLRSPDAPLHPLSPRRPRAAALGGASKRSLSGGAEAQDWPSAASKQQVAAPRADSSPAPLPRAPACAQVRGSSLPHSTKRVAGLLNVSVRRH
jgi:hypothetical protein